MPTPSGANFFAEDGQPVLICGPVTESLGIAAPLLLCREKYPAPSLNSRDEKNARNDFSATFSNAARTHHGFSLGGSYGRRCRVEIAERRKRRSDCVDDVGGRQMG